MSRENENREQRLTRQMMVYILVAMAFEEVEKWQLPGSAIHTYLMLNSGTVICRRGGRANKTSFHLRGERRAPEITKTYL